MWTLRLSNLNVVSFLSLDCKLTSKDGSTTFWTTTFEAQVMCFDYLKWHWDTLVYLVYCIHDN